MPRKAHNVSRQRSSGNAITINGLLTWRARRLRSLRLKGGDTASVEADLAAIDHVLVNVIGFDGDTDAITRDFRREAIFQRGELQLVVMAVLREANGPLTARQITERVMAIKDRTMHPGRDSKPWINRVRNKPWINRVRKMCSGYGWFRRSRMACRYGGVLKRSASGGP